MTTSTSTTISTATSKSISNIIAVESLYLITQNEIVYWVNDDYVKC